MNQHLTESQLNDYVDGAVDARSRAAIEAHHAKCAVCRSELQAMRSLVAEIGELPAQITPSRDLRAGIAERIARAEHHTVPAKQGTIRVMRRARFLAAAAVLVLATTTLTRWWVLRDTSDAPVAPALPPAPSAPLPVAFRTEEARYHDAIAELQRTLERSRAELAPQTIAILERNLFIIDRAIAESRAALAQDPANNDLSRMVLSAYEQKLQLLQRAQVSVL